jgi:hypothetical protein
MVKYPCHPTPEFGYTGGDGQAFDDSSPSATQRDWVGLRL